jgi:hypothetical protein
VAAATAKRKFRAARNTQGDRLDAGRITAGTRQALRCQRTARDRDGGTGVGQRAA